MNETLPVPEAPAAVPACAENDQTAAPFEPPTSLQSTPINGLFEGIARLIDTRGEPLLLSIVKLPSGELRVAVQPSKAAKESNESALPLISMGTPEEMDRLFFDQLSVYVAARTYAVASAEAIAQQIKTAADTARTKAEISRKPKTGTPAITSERKSQPPAAPPPPALKKNHGELTILTVPPTATLHVEDAKGKPIAAKPGEPQQYPAGRLTIRATCDGYGMKFHQHTVVVDKRETITIELAAKPGLFSSSTGEQPVPEATAEPSSTNDDTRGVVIPFAPPGAMTNEGELVEKLPCGDGCGATFTSEDERDRHEASAECPTYVAGKSSESIEDDDDQDVDQDDDEADEEAPDDDDDDGVVID
jgi:PRTRC genetic system protein E